MSSIPQTNVAGVRVTVLPAPLWVRALRWCLLATLFALPLLAVFAGFGWPWVVSNSALPGVAVMGITLIGSLGLTVWIARSSGFRTASKPAAVCLALALIVSADLALVSYAWRICPIPKSLAETRIDVRPIAAEEGFVPVYFWDYATAVSPAWFEKFNLMLPYEKGPPQKLLSKVYFEEAKSHSIVLELNGKRPRTYSPDSVVGLFQASGQSSALSPSNWALIARLQREAGLFGADEGFASDSLHLLKLSNGTQAIGVPWGDGKSGRAFFWGPGGSVFQIHCPSPCSLSRMLELVQFPSDVKGSLPERLKWTQSTLRELLNKAPPTEPAAKLRHEGLLSLYLISLLTLDPRDPEAFFHIGKLAKNRETVLSAIRYGRDLGLEPMKIVELQADAERMAQ
jgi:hypothetical protein